MEPWQAWILWTTVVAVVTSSLAEWPKRAWLKAHPIWRTAKPNERTQMVSPILAGIGVIVGSPVYVETGLVTSPILAIALSACVGLLSFTIYDVTLTVIRLIPRIVRKRTGVDTTSDVPVVRQEEKDRVE
jgi:hypothetical protein